MADERIFSEQEVADIIRRAAEITEEDAQKGYVPGVTYAELTKIAQEVGVDPRALSRAIEEAAGRKVGKMPFKFFDEFERVVEGEFDPSRYDELLEGLTPMGSKGESGITQVGRSLKLSTWNGVGQSKIDVVSRNGRTKVTVRSNSFVQAFYTLYPTLMGAIISAAALGEQGFGLAAAGVSAGLIALGTFLFGKTARAGHRRAKKQADDLSARVADVIAETNLEVRLAETAPAVAPERTDATQRNT